MLRKILLEGVSLGALTGDGTILWMVGNAAAYLLLGMVIFRWCERIAKRRGHAGPVLMASPERTSGLLRVKDLPIAHSFPVAFQFFCASKARKEALVLR